LIALHFSNFYIWPTALYCFTLKFIIWDKTLRYFKSQNL
jgi:hypothetical protein